MTNCSYFTDALTIYLNVESSISFGKLIDTTGSHRSQKKQVNIGIFMFNKDVRNRSAHTKQ